MNTKDIRVTRDTVYAAAEAIAATGVNPTNGNVREALEGGSYKNIAPLLKAWKRDRKAGGTTDATQEQAEQTKPSAGTDVDTVGQQIMSGAARAITEAFVNIVEHERTKSANAQQAIQDKAGRDIELANKGADARIRQAADEAEAEAADAAAEYQTLSDNFDAVEVSIAELTKVVAARDAAIAERAAAYGRLEQIVGTLTKQRDVANADASEAHAAQAAATERATAAEARATDLAKQLAAATAAATVEADRLAGLIAKATDDAKAERADHETAMGKVRAEIEALRAKHRSELDAVTSAQATAANALRTELAMATLRAEEAGKAVSAAGLRIEGLAAEVAKAVARAESAEKRADQILAGFAAKANEPTTIGQKGKATPPH